MESTIKSKTLRGGEKTKCYIFADGVQRPHLLRPHWQLTPTSGQNILRVSLFFFVLVDFGSFLEAEKAQIICFFLGFRRFDGYRWVTIFFWSAPAWKNLRIHNIILEFRLRGLQKHILTGCGGYEVNCVFLAKSSRRESAQQENNKKLKSLRKALGQESSKTTPTSGSGRCSRQNCHGSLGIGVLDISQ